MKNTITLKESSALSSGAVQVTPATAPAMPESAALPTPESVQDFHVPLDKRVENFRKLLDQRSTAPSPCELSCRGWGINE